MAILQARGEAECSQKAAHEISKTESRGGRGEAISVQYNKQGATKLRNFLCSYKVANGVRNIPFLHGKGVCVCWVGVVGTYVSIRGELEVVLLNIGGGSLLL